MEKKNYQKPSMKVHELKHKPRLLYGDSGSGYLGPQDTDLNKLA